MKHMQVIWILSKMIVSTFSAIDHVLWIRWDVACDLRPNGMSCFSSYLFQRRHSLSLLLCGSEIYAIPVQFSCSHFRVFIRFFFTVSLRFLFFFLDINFQKYAFPNRNCLFLFLLHFLFRFDKKLCVFRTQFLMEPTTRTDVNWIKHS